MNRSRTTPYFVELCRRTVELGGLFNAHLHIDRAGTYEDMLRLIGLGVEGASHLSLSKKHALIPLIHESACYAPEVLEARVEEYIDMMIDVGTTRADTVVDVTDDCVRQGALDGLMRIKRRRCENIDFRIGAYSPLGFRDDEPGRWALLEEAAAVADFIGSLPERDDQENYPDHIGFAESCRRILVLSAKLDKPLHMHVDQMNHDHEDGAECVIRLVSELGLGVPVEAEPRVWLVHVISPSTYDEERFATMVGSLAELNIGVICCPSAAISMRQLWPCASPTRNSIARVLEMLAAGVHVRLGSDNICDITSPAGTIDLIDEVFVLSNAVRYYDIEIMAKLAAGQRLEAQDLRRLAAHLAEDGEEVARAVAKYRGRLQAGTV